MKKFTIKNGVLINFNRYLLDKSFTIKGIIIQITIRRNTKKITIPKKVRKIDFELFEWHRELEKIKLPNTLKIIGNSAFKGTSIKTITLPEGLEEIRSEAFSYCEELEKINIPDSVTYIGKGAFCGTKITADILPDRFKDQAETIFYDYREEVFEKGLSGKELPF